MTVPRIVGTVTGGAAVEVMLAEEGSRRRRAIARTVRRLGIQLSNFVKAKKLTGQVLNVRTGRLRSSINARYQDDGADVSSTVGTAVEYAAFWELGFVGVQSVRAFVRRVKARNVSVLGSRSRDNGRRKRVLVAEGVAFVRAHQRRVSEPARPFLRPSLDEFRERILADLTRAAAGEAT